MNQLNETIRALRVQLEAEKSRENPNYEVVHLLETELENCLNQMLGGN